MYCAVLGQNCCLSGSLLGICVPPKQASAPHMPAKLQTERPCASPVMQVGYPCLSLHGGKDQSDRESTINDFKTDVCSLLIATGVAARGLDVKELVLVVNYDTPNHHEEYVHRVGRTGERISVGSKFARLAALLWTSALGVKTKFSVIQRSSEGDSDHAVCWKALLPA